MGRGTTFPKKNESRVMIRDAATQKTPSRESSRCWEFTLVGAKGGTAQPGIRVTGLIVGKRVIVSSHREALGFAPTEIAAKLIDAVRTTGKRLGGHVLTAGGDKFAPTVEICLI